MLGAHKAAGISTATCQRKRLFLAGRAIMETLKTAQAFQVYLVWRSSEGVAVLGEATGSEIL